MFVLAIIIAAIGLILLLRFGVTVVYGHDGLKVTARVGIIPIKIYPSDKKPKIKKKKRLKSAEELADLLLRRKKNEKKPGKLETFLQLMKLAKNTLDRLRRKLLIKNLDIHFVSAGKDPMQAALLFGSAHAVYGILEPILENNFRIRRRNFTSGADFEQTKPQIFVNAAFSIAVWEALYVLGALFSKQKEQKSEKNIKEIKTGEENTENGKKSD